jgi:hypothetical protein
VLEDDRQPVVLVERQPPQDHRVDDGEDGGAGADAERENGQGDERKRRRVAERA